MYLKLVVFNNFFFKKIEIFLQSPLPETPSVEEKIVVATKTDEAPKLPPKKSNTSKP